MEGEASWVTNSYDEIGRDLQYFEMTSEGNSDGENGFSLPSLDLLPDDLIERILACLPTASILRARSVCKRWRQIISSERFLWYFSNILSQKPWYFMFKDKDDPSGFAYDPILRKWYNIELPCIDERCWLKASSCGLVCFMENSSCNDLYVCNPITKVCRQIYMPPEMQLSDYSALSISMDLKSNIYTITLAKSKQVPHDFIEWDLSMDVYDSVTKSWITPVKEVLRGWRGGDECVICHGVFYIMIYSTGVAGMTGHRHKLIAYDLASPSSRTSLMHNSISMPCSLTCGRLMNLKDELVLVGGIGKQDKPEIIKGIGIWMLNKTEWEEITCMPHKYFHGFGEFDDVFSSSGTDDLIYIQSYGSPILLVFDLRQRQWKWSPKYPVSKRSHLQLFSGFCFEPRLDVSP